MIAGGQLVAELGRSRQRSKVLSWKATDYLHRQQSTQATNSSLGRIAQPDLAPDGVEHAHQRQGVVERHGGMLEQAVS